MNHAQRRKAQFAHMGPTLSPNGYRPQPHEWDEDARCIHCGFDGAEAWHLRHSIPPHSHPKQDPSERFCSRRPMVKT